MSQAGAPSDIEDAGIVAGLARGDADALSAAYADHSRAVFEFARCTLGQRVLAEEVVQDVFVRLWDRPDRFDPGRGSLRTYLLTLAYGRSIDVARSESARRRREERDARLGEADGRGADDAETRFALADEVQLALARLRDEERQAIALAFFLGYSYREVASELGAPVGTIKNRIRAGLARLRAQLEPDEPVVAG